jgi:Ankyrin repeats (3 copies)
MRLQLLKLVFVYICTQLHHHAVLAVSRLMKLGTATPALIDARDPDTGWSPLHFAARQGHAAAVEWLIASANAFVGARGPAGYTPLHLAAGRGPKYFFTHCTHCQCNT